MPVITLDPVAAQLLRLAHDRRESDRELANARFNDAMRPLFEREGLALGEHLRYSLHDNGTATLTTISPPPEHALGSPGGPPIGSCGETPGADPGPGSTPTPE